MHKWCAAKIRCFNILKGLLIFPNVLGRCYLTHSGRRGEWVYEVAGGPTFYTGSLSDKE